jgi:hypothetical protein
VNTAAALAFVRPTSKVAVIVRLLKPSASRM